MPNPLEIIASLLSERYPGRGLNINDPVITPPSIPNQPWTGGSPPPSTPWGSPPTLVNPPGPVPGGSDGGGRGPDVGRGEPEGYGKMSPGMRAGIGVAGTLAGLAGLGPLGWGLGAMGLASDKLAGPYESNPYAGLRATTPQGIRDIADYEGMINAKEAADALAQRESDIAANKAAISDPMAGFTGISEGRTDRDVGGFGAIGSDSSNAGASSGAEGGNTGAGGRDGEGGSGEGRGGDTDWQGGVRVGTPQKPGKTVFGKVGKETAIFVPEIMKKMGLQGREQEVITALQTMLRLLTGNQESRQHEAGESRATAQKDKKEKADGGRRK